MEREVKHQMETDLLTELTFENASQYLQSVYINSNAPARQSLIRRILNIFGDNPNLEETLDVNSSEPLSGEDRLRPYYSLLIWLGLSLILFLVTRFGLDVWNWVSNHLGANQEIIQRIFTETNFNQLLEQAATNPESRRRIIELAVFLRNSQQQG